MDFGDNGQKFYPNGTITAYKPDLFDRWGDSENFLGKTSYGIADGFYLATSILPGSEQRHLNGQSSLPNERIGAFISTATTAFPVGKVGQIIPKVNAAQFSSLVAETFLARLAPTTRGIVIKTVNKASGSISVKTFPSQAATISKIINNDKK
ncbi:hypothetical protein [Pedobacter ginsengisoli]|uniref:hypothetical protein n=1 Tax=Pedobacter ginsengisoli TaxID=363852 RepID=UPI00254D5DFF|nr:hypothetical protein [Pedobacter ginsengisoli]